MNTPAGSITRLIPGVLVRDDHAIQELWRRYVSRVQGVARPLMQGLAPGAGDDEDVAQSTFRAFFDAAAKGQTPQLDSLMNYGDCSRLFRVARRPIGCVASCELGAAVELLTIPRGCHI